MQPEIISKYFTLTQEQQRQMDSLGELYTEWNAKINVISRKDIDELYVRHALHSLAIAKVCSFAPGARVVDIGCGGGFPTIPLAILFPEVEFTAVDSIGKKITVVREVASALGLKNVTPINARIEAVKGEFDYVVSRAVTDLKTLKGWALPKLRSGQRGTLPNGMLILKGGNLTEEIADARLRCDIHNISDLFEEEFFETKQVIYAKR
ncbi:MAG: 16S rRNA (guanine(527)-N(7))-methyltransferase RsmG [Tidjanibacter sp.]|nr:16S rRNA (guanine(527)-N(7))-methyltransferase RsmG [Tidjanibacter sp.]